MNTAALILAAGAGTRMKSSKPKVAHEILGRPLVNWVIAAAHDAGIETQVVVVGHGADQVGALLPEDIQIAHQPEQLGTADAVAKGLAALAGFDGSVVVLSGDCPLITPDTISKLIAAREHENAACTVLTMRLDNPFGYGRIIREDTFLEGVSPTGEIVRIVEEKDANEDERAVTECNAGFYCFDARLLASALERVGSDNAQGEFYLTDVMEILRNEGKGVHAVLTDDASECLGVNSRIQLAEATAVMQGRINTFHMENGVTMLAPALVWIGPDVTIEPDVELLQNVTLMGATSIKSGSLIGPDSRLFDTRVGHDCVIDETVAYEAQLDDGATAGPRAYLRPGAHLCDHAKAGTHVEIKKSTIGKGSKVPHLSYIGDTTMGEGVNIGAGSITCNYDGVNKHPTVIGNNCFIGSDTMMVAPVTIGDDVLVGAGSVITKDVPTHALAVARAREKIMEGWTSRKKKQS